MSCGCGCNSCTDDGLLAGLSGPLMSGIVVAGSRLKVGFELTFFSIYDTAQANAAIQRCLMNTGGFSAVTLTFNQPSLSRHYLVVEAVASQGFEKAQDFGDLVEGAIKQCAGAQIEISRRDPEIVLSVPPQYGDDPNVEQPGTGPVIGDGSTIDQITQDLGLDQIATDLGIKPATLLIGAGAIVLVLVLKR